MIMVVVPQDFRKIAKYSHSHDNFKCADAKCIASSATYIKQSHFGCYVSFPHVANWVSFMPMSILDVISGFSRRRVIKFARFFFFFYVLTVPLFWLLMDLFFPGMEFCICGLNLPGTPLLSLCFLWIVGLKFEVKQPRTIFPLQMRVHHENVSGFS